MKSLASQIDRELQVGEWKHCVVYERELRRLWPLNEKDREAQITQFAKEIRLPAEVLSQGTVRNLRQMAATKATFVILTSQIRTRPPACRRSHLQAQYADRRPSQLSRR